MILNQKNKTTIEIYRLSASMKACKNAGLSSGSFLAFLKFKRTIDEVSRRYEEDMKVLMDGYKIKLSLNPLLGGRVYEYDRHAKASEIRAKVEALNNVTHRLDSICFMSPGEFYEFTKGLNMDDVALMANYLLKES